MADLGAMHIPVEVVVSTLADLKAAADGGADRVELCVDLGCGGLTPGRSLTEAAAAQCSSLGLGLRVLIRPRTGDFVFDADERTLIVREAEATLALGAEKVVVGGLDAEGLPDRELLGALGHAVGMEAVVFHRALDEAVHYGQALQRLEEAGVKEVLTSGGEGRAVEGISGIAQAAQHFSVVAGSGVLPDQVDALVSAGAHAVHASCRTPQTGQRQGRLFDAARSVVDAERVRALVEAVRAVARP